MRPLYEQLHGYVRQKLRNKFGSLISEDGPIPMHLLGNMWGQSWENVSIQRKIEIILKNSFVLDC